MPLQATISHACVLLLATWKAPYSASARRSTASLERLLVGEPLVRHLAVKLERLRESTAKSRRGEVWATRSVAFTTSLPASRFPSVGRKERHRWPLTIKTTTPSW